MFGHLFDNSIEMVNWLLDHNLRGEIKVASYLQSDRNFGYLPVTVLTLAAKYSFEDYLPSSHTTLKRLFNVESTLFQCFALWVELRKIYIKMKRKFY